MLAALGVFARVNSVALSEDIPMNEEEWHKGGFKPKYITQQYGVMSNNCFIGAGIYVLVLIFAGIQYHLNMRSSYALS